MMSEVEKQRRKHQRLISLSETQTKVPLGRTRIWQLIRDGKFPKPVKLGERRLAFVEDEVDAFIAQRIAERDGAQADA